MKKSRQSTDKKAVVRRKPSEVAKPKTIDEMRAEMEEILPDKGGLTRLTVGFGDISVTVPVPGETLKEVMKKGRVKNRTLLDLGLVKLGVDIS
jgi:hypothetical protein